MAKVNRIARVCHSVLRDYGMFHNPKRESVHIDEAPACVRESISDGVSFVVNNPDATPADLHNHWVELRTQEGWKCGRVKDTTAKIHPNLCPFAALPRAEKLKSVLFLAVAKGSML